MHFLVCLLLVGIANIFEVVAETCCLPTRFEGQLHTVESNDYFTFAADFELGRMFQAKDPLSETYSVVNLLTPIIYNFENGECTSMTFRGVAFYKQCLDDFAFLGRFTVGEANFGTHAISLQTQYSSGVMRTALFTPRSDDTCFPLLIHDNNVMTHNTRSYFATDLIATVSRLHDVRIRSDVTNCTFIPS